jgi:EAL domain-containing protein (putative c-di-GMP-specific phosphodiesterase class I)
VESLYQTWYLLKGVFTQSVAVEGYELFVTTSIGISLFPGDGEEPETLLKNADAAMYRAKEQGKNNYQYYSSGINTKASEGLSMENSLRHALERGEFRLHYQPRVDLATGCIFGAEALIRWQDPERGLVSPAEFIPLAEETGLIVPIGEWILRTACAQNKAWQTAGLSSICVAVNLSGRQFQEKELLEKVVRALRESDLSPRFLELELTESIIMKNAEHTIETLCKFHEMGIEIAIDDFGIGYSSLNYLKRFPIGRLKIDQSFVRDITTDPDDSAIVAAIITMAHSLKLKVVAEAVETPDQLEFLRQLQCDEIQGYLFSRPLPPEEMTKLLKVGKRL